MTQTQWVAVQTQTQVGAGVGGGAGVVGGLPLLGSRYREQSLSPSSDLSRYSFFDSASSH